MAYSNIAYILSLGVTSEEVLAGLADKVNDPADINAPAAISNVEGCISRADALIDSALRTIHSGPFPLASPPMEVQTCSAEMALYLLWASTEIPHDENPRAEMWDFYNKWLSDIARGLKTLDLGGAPTNTPTVTRTRKTYADREFSPDTLRGRF